MCWNAAQRNHRDSLPAVAKLSATPVALHADGSVVDWASDKPHKIKATSSKRIDLIPPNDTNGMFSIGWLEKENYSVADCGSATLCNANIHTECFEIASAIGMVLSLIFRKGSVLQWHQIIPYYSMYSSSFRLRSCIQVARAAGLELRNRTLAFPSAGSYV
jgi:hypothetical protein